MAAVGNAGSPSEVDAIAPTGWPAVSVVGAAGDPATDSLLILSKWGGGVGAGSTLDYSFATLGSVWAPSYGSYAEPLNGFQAFTPAQQAAARLSLARWSEVANITFVEVAETSTDVGVIRFAVTDASPSNTAHAYYPAASARAGDVWLDSYRHNASTSYAEGTYGYQTMLHEIGHALGLKHPHGVNGTGVVAPASEDWLGTSIMSYRSFPNDDLKGYNTGTFYPAAPMLHDILAIQYLYGANLTTRSGDTIYHWSPGERLFETIWDAGGADTIDWSNQSSAAVLRLGAGQWSELGQANIALGGTDPRTLAIAYNVTIENATGGSASDSIYGNDVANQLAGQDGNDVINGYGGADIIDGGLGDDTVDGGLGADLIYLTQGADQLTGGAGSDTFVALATNIGTAGRVLDFTLGDFLRFQLDATIQIVPITGATEVIGYWSGVPGERITLAGTVEAGIVTHHLDASYQYLSFEPGPFDDHLNNAGTTSVLSNGEPSAIFGSLEAPGDRDWFVVTLTAGVTYTFRVEGTDTGFGTLADPHLVLHNGAGAQIAQDNDSGIGLNAKLNFTPTASGLYFVNAGEQGNDATGTYRVSVQTASPGDDYPATTATAGTLAPGQVKTGVLGTLGDHDWFKLNLTSGKGYTLRVEGSPTGAGTLPDPALAVRNATGTIVAQDDNTGTGLTARLSFIPAQGGTFYLDAAASRDAGTGTYKVGLQIYNAVQGTAANNTTNGTAAADLMRGLGGDDRLFGKAGGDQLEGGPGNDLLQGDGAIDVLLGGGGSDRFTYVTIADSTPSSPDLILDFAATIDLIDLAAIDANSGLSGNQAFSFIGYTALTGPAQLRARYVSGIGTFVEASNDADAAVELTIKLADIDLQLGALSFIL